LKVAYLLNQYPMPSQTFVRREIAALETLGWTVERCSVRSAAGQVVDADDLVELGRTRVVLDGRGAAVRLAAALLVALVRRPGAFVRAALSALALGRGSDRGIGVHLVYLAEACVLVRWFEASGVDHVHSHFGTNGPTVALLVEALGGPPFSFTVHGPEEFDRPEGLHLREKVRAATFVVTISSFGRSQLMRWSDVEDWQKIYVIRCGVDDAFLGDDPSPVPASDRLVCIGRLGEQKGHLVLIEAAVALRDEGVGFHLVLAGEGPMRPEIEAAIAAAGLGEHVTLAGWVDNARVRAELDEARALVLPSFAEGLPVAIMEALALGRPVVTTAIAGIPELVDDECGWLVPAGSAVELTAALRDVLGTPADRLTAMGRAGRARVLADHDVRAGAAALATLFERA
jgi:glycosyltransferase involved in cell wall biosynthesis